MPGLVRTGGRNAVMATRAPMEREEDTPQQKLWRTLNYFPTPPWAARAGAELVQRLDPGARSIWEPACGGGHMAEPLREYFPEVRASDIHDHGYERAELVDFLDHRPNHEPVDWVFTNPPFSVGPQFAQLGLDRATRGVILLGRVQFIEGQRRHQLMSRLAFYAPFAERVPMALGRWDPALTSATAYAYFVWMHPRAMEESPLAPALLAAQAFGAHLSQTIPPGTKARLWRAEDPRRFGYQAPAALFDLGTDGGQSGAAGGSSG